MANLIPFRSGFPFDSFFDDFLRLTTPYHANFGGFKLDVREEEQSYEIEADLPGVNKENVELSLKEGTLEISVNKDENIENKDESRNFLHRERRFSSCKRSIYLGDADPSNITAKLENGVLQISVPKMPKTANRHSIMIQ